MTRSAEGIQQLLDKYVNVTASLRTSCEGLTETQLKTPSAPGRWSVLQVVAHLADFELVFADRIKRILAEENPALPNGDPDLFEKALAYHERDLNEELCLIECLHGQVARILRAAPPTAFARTGVHSTDGPITLERVVEKAIWHLNHHREIIDGKRPNLLGPI